MRRSTAVRLWGLLFLFFAMASANSVRAEMTFTVWGGETVDDQRDEYPRDLIHLALEATKEDYGDYKLSVTPVGENSARSLASATSNNYDNYFTRQSVTTDRIKNLGYVAFPVDRGIVGYRVAFVSDEIKKHLRSVNTIDELKKLSIVQGIGWLDSKILRMNGFTVKTGSSYTGLFHMVANNRADMFFRGTNELIDEWKSHKNINGLTYDEEIAVYYPLPRFFFTAKKNTIAIERIREGLLRIYSDGSLFELWETHYRTSLDFVKLDNRRIFYLESPLIDELDPSYKQYIFKP